MSKNGFTAEQVIRATEGSGGIVTQIAKRLGCSRMTVYRYMEKYATVALAIQEEREGLLDIAESELLKQIRGGNMTAIIFFLKTQGKRRGYVERQEHKLDIGKISELTDDELRAIVES